MDEKSNLNNELDPVEEMLVDKLTEQGSEAAPEQAEKITDSEIAETEPDAVDDAEEIEAPAEELSEEDEFFNSVGETIENTVETGELPAKQKVPFALSGAFLNEAIRVLAGLILLVFSRMSFVASPLDTILALAAVVVCGLPLVLRALEDFKSRNYLNENVIVFAACVFCVLFGGVVDGVIALVIADVGFNLRDYALDWYRGESDKLLKGASSDTERDIVEPTFHIIDSYFTPAVAFVAVISGLLSLIFAGDNLLPRLCSSCAVLAASAPLMITAITALVYDIGKGSAIKKGIRFTDVKSIVSAAKLSSVIFNKTGTVTAGKYYVSGVYPVKISAKQLISLAAYAEIYSNHPLAEAIKSAYGAELDPRRVTQQREEKGSGSFVQLAGGNIVAVGNIELMEKLGVKGDMIPSDCVSVYVAVGKTFVGRIDFEDEVNPGAAETVSRIRKCGVANVALMTGDNTLSATRIARGIGISEVYADCTPRDKYERVQYIMGQQQKDECLGYITSANSDVRASELANLKIVLGENESNLAGTAFIPSGDIAAIPALINEAKAINLMVKICTIAILAAKGLSILLALIGIVGVSFVVCLDVVVAVAAAFAAMFRLGK
ncbi:MAG: cation-translocating P-type ATPase [Oscillospiraceae bacterium]|nr:cation-translocating P-type ATPase [Oscillospiraceae bacterium]